LLKDKARALKVQPGPGAGTILPPESELYPPPGAGPISQPEPPTEPPPAGAIRTFRISGEVPPEIWNRIGIKVIPKLRSGSDLKVNVSFVVTVDERQADNFQVELKQILTDLNLYARIRIEPG